MSKRLEVKFIKDVPLGNNQNNLFDFYHKNVAPAFKEILENDSCVHTIGLFSKWGTGKSTIIEMIRNDLKSPVFVFDAWKYQEDSLRRIFLIQFVDFLITTGELSEKDRKLLDALYKSKEEHQEIKTAENPFKKELSWESFFSFVLNNWFLVVFVVCVFVLVTSNYFVQNKNLIFNLFNNFIGTIAATSLLATVFKPVLKKILEAAAEDLFSSLKPITSTKIRVEKEDRLNSPEQFEEFFKAILRKINKKVVIVFDNIDRVQGDTAIKILSTVKTFLDPAGVPGPIFIVPCDSLAIKSQIERFYSVANQPNFNASEYMRKLFNLIIWAPEFIESDLHGYIKKLTEETGEAKILLEDEDVIYVINSAFPNNPREIKQFINNLMAALVMASKTEVWPMIKENIAYLAKVLILREKYEGAYQKLKERWFEPEKIFQDGDDIELKNFMLNTSRITVKNAQPFLYFKQPAIFKELDNSDELILSLAEGNKDKFKDLVLAESNKQELFNFIQYLLKNYKSQKGVLFNIFKVHLETFQELKISSNKKIYYESLAKVLDADLWQFFDQLPTGLVFSNILLRKELDPELLKPIAKRYALAVGMQELGKPDKIPVLKEIIKNIKENKNIFSAEDLAQVSKFIDENHFSNLEIVSLFETYEDQNIFLTSQGFDKFINGLDIKSISASEAVVIKFKEFSNKKNKFTVILTKIIEILNKETSASPQLRPEKLIMFKTFNRIFGEFQNQFGSISDPLKAQLAAELVRSHDSMNTWDGRATVINSFYWISFFAPDPQKTALKTYISNFFRQAQPENIVFVFEYRPKEEVEKIIANYITVLIPRCMQEEAVLEVFYKRADKEQKMMLIQNLVGQKGSGSLGFLKKIQDELPDRQATVKTLLTKSTSLNLNEQVLIYDFLRGKIAKNDSTDIKDMAVNQIKILLKSDSRPSQETGRNFLLNSEFLSEEKKREILKELLDWLRQPGKKLTSMYYISLKVISELSNILQETPIKDFVYSVFDMLRPDRDKDSLLAALEILGDLKPIFLNSEKDFRDLLSRLKEWPENENKRLVIEKLKHLKSQNPNREEKKYWEEIV